jgi:hypothetical protein
MHTAVLLGQLALATAFLGLVARGIADQINDLRTQARGRI